MIAADAEDYKGLDQRTISPQIQAPVNRDATESELQIAVQARDAAIVVQNALLQEKDELLRQKDNLLREVNHRIKNSLQLVSSLLALQARTAKNAEVRAHLAAAGLRVSAIGRAHQRLYRTNELATIDLGGYLRRLCEDIAESLSDDGAKPTLIVDATELAMPTDHAISVGLIVSELITNAIKHAYGGANGTVEVKLHALDLDRLVLSVADHGRGLPEGFDPSGSTGLGMKILAALIKSLHAELEFGQPAGGRGARFAVTFSRTNLVSTPADQPA
jgi:two-component sensor histidine kinase